MALVLPEPVNATFFAVYATDISIADVVFQYPAAKKSTVSWDAPIVLDLK